MAAESPAFVKAAPHATQQGMYVEIWQRMVYTAQVVFEVSVCFAYVHVDAGLPSIAYSYFMFDK